MNLVHYAVHIAAGSDGTLWHTAGDADIYRYISEGTKVSSPLPPGVPNGTSVDRVAATGFGSAYVLSAKTAQVYNYETPYVFKSADAYFTGFNVNRLNQSLSLAGHTLFLSTYPTGASGAIGQVLAVDAQTGAQRWKFALPSGGNSSPNRSSRNVYDAALDLLYVVAGTSVYALNASTGKQVWRLDTSAAPLNFVEGELGSSGLAGNLLVVGHGQGGKVIAIDTTAPLDRANRKVAQETLWVASTITSATAETNTGAPEFDQNGQLYLMSLVGQNVYLVRAMDASTGTMVWQQWFTLDQHPGPDQPLGHRARQHARGHRPHARAVRERCRRGGRAEPGQRQPIGIVRRAAAAERTTHRCHLRSGLPR